MTSSSLAGIPRPTLSLLLLAIGFTVAGMLHLVRPAPYIRIMPPWLPAPAALVLISGVAEIAGGLGILLPLTRVAAGWGLIVLLVAVFPANVQMLLGAVTHHASRGWIALLVARLPLQIVLIWWVWRTAVRPSA
jgi:uncharacterized membrane protein